MSINCRRGDAFSLAAPVPASGFLGNEVASINLRAEAERLHLSYTLRVGDGEWEDMAETIPIVFVGGAGE